MRLEGNTGGRILKRLAAVVMACGLASGAAHAQSFLTNGNSSVTINAGSSTGMNNWSIDGQNQLNQQWFWFGYNGSLQSINNLALAPVVQPSPGTLVTTYANSTFSIQITYSLVGGAAGSGTADLSEQIKIQNLTGAALSGFQFYQYADFSVNSSIVQLGKNLKGLYNEALVTSGNVSVDENVDSALAPGANYGEAEQYNVTLNKLNGGVPFHLDNTATNGPGHTTWAFEWDPTAAMLGPGQTFIISKDLNIAGVSPVPEPAVSALVSIGLLAFGALKLRRSRSR